MTESAASDFAASQALVVFTPSGKRGRFAVGTPLLQAARTLGVDIDSVCGGRAICGRCQVLPAVGEFAKHGITSKMEHLSTLSSVEENYQGLSEGRRLSCQTQILGDVVIDVPADSQVHKQVVRKAAEAHDIALDAATRLYYVEVQEPNMHDPSGDWRRVQDALEFEWGLKEVGCDLAVLQRLQPVLREGAWKITLAVYKEQAGVAGDLNQQELLDESNYKHTVVAVWPGLKQKIYGLAVDVGSTTVAAHLCELDTGLVVVSSGMMNPQIRFGEDLMSRVSYVMMNPGGEQEMTAAVREALDALAQSIAEEAGIAPSDILEATFVGNPVMHHLLLGINPVELGGAPFALATDQAITLPARDLGLHLHTGARVYILPCIAGHVGADTAGVVLAERPDFSNEMTLLVDVGTNAEIVLGNHERLLACSSPTGPAFEGAQISGGQRAAPGAIERVRIDPETLEPRFRVIGSELWSNETGFTEAVAALGSGGVTGICGSGIIELVAEAYLAGIILHDGTIDGDLAARSPRIQEDGRTFVYEMLPASTTIKAIRLTQNDVRAIQLAKAALYAGIKLLMERLHVQRVDRIRLAGAFGSHIDVKYAMVLGMIPDCALSQVSSAGNAAGTGARIALLNVGARREIENLVRRIEKIETAVEPQFQAFFVEAMAIPHLTEAMPELQKTVTLPARKARSEGAHGRTGGRRARANRGG